jgi:hypothetical protein
MRRVTTSLTALALALAATLFIAEPLPSGDDQTRLSGPTHPTEPGGKKHSAPPASQV